MTEVIQEILSEMRAATENPMLGVTTEEGRAVEKFVKDVISDWAKTLEDEITAADKRHLAAYNSKCDANDCMMAKLKEQRSVNMHNESLLNKAGETVVGLMNKMSAQDEEIKKLREVANKLADALEAEFKSTCEISKKLETVFDHDALAERVIDGRELIAEAKKATKRTSTKEETNEP